MFNLNINACEYIPSNDVLDGIKQSENENLVNFEKNVMEINNWLMKYINEDFEKENIEKEEKRENIEKAEKMENIEKAEKKEDTEKKKKGRKCVEKRTRKRRSNRRQNKKSEKHSNVKNDKMKTLRTYADVLKG
jgi:hypothetical protein